MQPRPKISVETTTFASSLKLFRELKKRYRHLYEAKVVPIGENAWAFDKARLYKRGDTYALFAKGDAFEMAFQHGKLLSRQVNEGVLMQLSKTIPNHLENSVSQNPLLNKLVIALVNYFGHRLREHMPWESLVESFALSEGSGLALHHISNSMIIMEALYILAKYATRTGSIDPGSMAFAGCSSFAVWNEFSADRELLIGRNLDYPLNGYFDAHPLVTYFEPTDGGQRYLSLGTAGLHPPSLTCMNESGIYLAAHLIPTEETSFEGTPMYFLVNDIIRHATTFDEAVHQFRQRRVTLGWAFVLASTKEKRVATVEITNQRVAVRESTDGKHFLSNHFSFLESANLFVNHSVDEDTKGRYFRMSERVRQAGRVDVKTAASILGDSFDPWMAKERGLGSTVAVHITVGSTIFEPEKNRMWVGQGLAPTSQNEWLPFPLFGDWKEPFAKMPDEKVEAHLLKRGKSPLSAAVQSYIKAKMAYEFDCDNETAYRHLVDCTKLDDLNPAYHFVAAIFALKTDRWGEAIEGLSHVIGFEEPAHLRSMALYYRGRVYASRGNREAALADFEHARRVANLDPKLGRAIAKAMTRTRLFGRFSLSPKKLPILMQFADFVYYG